MIWWIIAVAVLAFFVGHGMADYHWASLTNEVLASLSEYMKSNLSVQQSIANALKTNQDAIIGLKHTQE